MFYLLKITNKNYIKLIKYIKSTKNILLNNCYKNISKTNDDIYDFYENFEY